MAGFGSSSAMSIWIGFPVPRLCITATDSGSADHSSGNIEQSWVEDNTVQLRNVQENARLCVQAWTRALKSNGDGSYSLRNGPFMRRFLDGYYPMRVSMQIDYASSGLQLIDDET